LIYAGEKSEDTAGRYWLFKRELLTTDFKSNAAREYHPGSLSAT
jgi:hypothetical protein